MSILVGTPSDDAPAILATGRTDITTLFVSMSARHPEGHDADYLEWHSLDHRPEQHRLESLRASLRLVSTPACRAARVIANERYEATDHLMTYLFKGVGGLPAFGELATALTQAGRMPYLLPAVERAVYPSERRRRRSPHQGRRRRVAVVAREGRVRAHRARRAITVRAVARCPVWPESGGAAPCRRTRSTRPLSQPGNRSPTYLDDDPADAARRLRPALERRWKRHSIEPLLAAPFQVLVPYAWDRFVP